MAKDQFKFDIKQAVNTVVSWRRLKSLRWPIREGCEWITDASIQHCIKNNLFENAYNPQTALSHHDARIAFLVRRLHSGKALDPIHLHVSNHKISIFDGAHRLRAHQFLGNDNIEVRITSAPLLLESFREAYNAVPLVRS
jgi:hypothetical protein